MESFLCELDSIDFLENLEIAAKKENMIMKGKVKWVENIMMV